MSQIEIRLPKGSLGIELAPALDGKWGCDVKSWRSDKHALSKQIPVGTSIIKIDGVSTQQLPFKEAISLLGNSMDRVITCRIPSSSDPSTDSESHDRNNLESLSDCTADACIQKEVTVTDTSLSMENDRSTGRVDRQRDGKILLLGGKVKQQSEELQKTRAKVKMLEEQIKTKQELIASLQSDIGALKSDSRCSDGKITLLSFQLDKMRQSVLNAEGASSVVPSNSTNQEEDLQDDRVLHFGKMIKVLSELVPKSSEEIASDQDDQSSELQREVMILQRVNERLEAQMRSWVEDQIKLHKQLAAEEVIRSMNAVENAEADTVTISCSRSSQAGYDIVGSRVAVDNDRTNTPKPIKSNECATNNDISKSLTVRATSTPCDVAELVEAAQEFRKLSAKKLISEFPNEIDVSIEYHIDKEPECLNNTALEKENQTRSSNAKLLTHFEPVSPASTSILLSKPTSQKFSALIRPGTELNDIQQKDIRSKESEQRCKIDIVDRIMQSGKRSSKTPKADAVPKYCVAHLSPYELIDDGRDHSRVDESMVSDMSFEHVSVHTLQSKGCNRSSPSPSILRLSDQMNKLSGENASIRADLLKFRGIIQVSYCYYD
jgi:hypothetical protein